MELTIPRSPRSRTLLRPAFTAVLAALALACLLSGCGTSGHRLPPYERPIARTEYQSVRTTAYTHTEADHLAYGNHNALGGTLHAAAVPARLAYAAQAIPVANPQDIVDEQGGFHRQPFLDRPVAPMGGHLPPGAGTYASASLYSPAAPTYYGSAAADWSRWPAGTIFRIESTGQLYRVDDYGWALAGRNTIDLYESSRADMNAWGVRQVPIHVLHWGDRAESLRRLRNHQGYKHIRRMVYELEGKTRAAARLE